MIPLISVVVTTKNSGTYIASCLQSIKDQTYRNYEIIVVDNSSQDETKSIALQYTKHVYNFGPERSAQRNYGVKKSKGKYLLYLDSDMTLDKNVITECVNKLERSSNIVALYIPEIIIGDRYWSKVRQFERSFYNATVIDCVRFLRIESFYEIGGFDETMSGPEDWDFDKKIRRTGKVDIVSSLLYHNETQFNVKNYIKKKGYYAESFSKYINKWGKDDPDIKKQFGLLYRYLTVFLEKGKWKKIIAHPLLTFGMLYLRLLVGLKYLTSE